MLLALWEQRQLGILEIQTNVHSIKKNCFKISLIINLYGTNLYFPTHLCAKTQSTHTSSWYMLSCLPEIKLNVSFCRPAACRRTWKLKRSTSWGRWPPTRRRGTRPLPQRRWRSSRWNREDDEIHHIVLSGYSDTLWNLNFSRTVAGITKWFWVTIEEYLRYLLPKFEDLVPTSLGSGAI